jgi:hypothetical protein
MHNPIATNWAKRHDIGEPGPLDRPANADAGVGRSLRGDCGCRLKDLNVNSAIALGT